jgi:hypothetical protein
MDRTAKILDRIFWASLAATGALPILAGCTNFEQAGQALTTPGPDGKTPVDSLVDAIPAIVANPFNPSPWITVAAVIGTAVTGFFGAKKVKAHKAKKAIAKAKEIADKIVVAVEKK